VRLIRLLFWHSPAARSMGRRPGRGPVAVV